MKTYIYIAVGGLFGAISRYLIKSIFILDYRGEFPLNTLIINITGSLIIAFVLTLTLHWIQIGTELRLGITVGFLGSYTTFSALCKEMAVLISTNNYGTAFLYISSSIILGLLSVYAGITSARAIIKNKTNKTKPDGNLEKVSKEILSNCNKEEK